MDIDIQSVFAEVRAYRAPMKAEPINSVWDLAKPANDVLLSYMLEVTPTADAPYLAGILSDISADELQKYSPKSFQPIEGALRQKGPHGWTADLRARGIFGISYGDALLVADMVQKSYIYPNGETVVYKLLFNEASANMPVSTVGLGLTNPHEVFVRQDSVDLMSAWLELVKDEDDFSSYNHLGRFAYDTLGIIISHELIEATLQDDERPLDKVEEELLVERKSKKILEERGIPHASYEVFHKLRSSKEGDPSISDLVLQEL